MVRRRSAGAGACLLLAGCAAEVNAEALSDPPLLDDQPALCLDAFTTAAPELASDPVCVDKGRYRVTEEVVLDAKDGYHLWERRTAARRSQPEAVAYCSSLRLEGLTGWRLPTPPDLSAIRYKPGGLFGGGPTAHYCIPSIDQAAFPDTPAELFWTSKVAADGTAWYVGFDDGRSHRDDQSDELWVRCVHDLDALPGPC